MFPNIQVSVEPSKQGPVLVKVAETDEAVERLSVETDRLDRAAHPGVVEVLERDEGRLVLAWAGGQTLASYQAAFPQLAAVLASLSATVADLHDLGVVHGAIQADHVIIGGDGRPRLCGFGGPVGRIDRSGPADDVAAVGQLITDLVGDGAEIEPIPERRWGRRRWSGYLRRALLTLADQATDPDAAHRPTARTLAASIADAVPDARIEPAPTSDPLKGATSMDLAAHDDAGPYLEGAVAGTDGEPEPDADTMSPRHGESDTVSGAGAELHGVDPTGSTFREPAEAVSGISSEPSSGPDGPLEVGGEPLVVVDHLVPTAHAGEARDPRNARDADEATDPRGETEPGDETAKSATTAATTGGSFESTVTGHAEAAPEPGTSGGPAPDRTVLGLRTEGSGPREHMQPDDVDRLRPEARRRTIQTPPAHEMARSWRTVAITGVAATVLAMLGVALWPSTSAEVPTTAAPPPPASSPAPAGTPDPPKADAPTPNPTSVGVDCVDVSGSVADVDGDGCQEPVTIDATIITAGRRTYEVGEAGDALSLGDWNCDGQITPGLVRPKTGEVFLFGSWPDDDAGITVDAATVIPDAERLEPGPTGPTCSPSAVVLAGGARRSIEGRSP